MSPRSLQRILLASAVVFSSGASAACHYTEIATLPLQLESTGAPSIEVRLNNEAVTMLADTGFRRTAFSKQAIDHQQLHIMHEKPVDPLELVHVRQNALSVRPDSVVIGPLRANQSYFTVLSYEPIQQYGGIVGADYLLRNDLEIALANKKMTMFKGEGCQDKALAYWDAEALEAPLQRPAGFAAALVKVKLNGKSTWALIDTGAPYSMVDVDFARRINVTSDSAGTVAVANFVRRDGASDPMWSAPFDSFSVGDETIKNPHFAVIDIIKPGYSEAEVPGMVLGRDFLRAHRILLSLEQERMYFSYLGGPVFSPPQ